MTKRTFKAELERPKRDTPGRFPKHKILQGLISDHNLYERQLRLLIGTVTEGVSFNVLLAMTDRSVVTEAVGTMFPPEISLPDAFKLAKKSPHKFQSYYIWKCIKQRWKSDEITVSAVTNSLSALAKKGSLTCEKVSTPEGFPVKKIYTLYSISKELSEQDIDILRKQADLYGSLYAKQVSVKRRALAIINKISKTEV